MRRALWCLIVLTALTGPASAQGQDKTEAKVRTKLLHLNEPVPPASAQGQGKIEAKVRTKLLHLNEPAPPSKESPYRRGLSSPPSQESPYHRGLSSLELGNYAQAIVD